MLERNSVLRDFLYFLDAIHYSCTIAVDSPWGSGKTFFVKSAQLLLEGWNPNIPMDNEIDFCMPLRQTFLPIYYDAWANDNVDDPLQSLIYTIATNKSVEKKNYFQEHPKFLEIAAAVMDAVRGTGMKDLYDLKNYEDFLEKVKAAKDIEKKIHDFLQECLKGIANRIVIFIDELDRCRPSFAVQLLERIKHYFHDKNVIFVFAINSAELVHTISAFYGENFDANRYLNRFFDFRLGLPQVDINNYLDWLKYSLTSDSMKEIDIYRHEIVRAVAKHFNLSLREIQKLCLALRTVGGYTANRKKYMGSDPVKKFCFYVLLPIVFALKMTESKLYDDFIHGKNLEPLLVICDDSDVPSYLASFRDDDALFGISLSIWPNIKDSLKKVYDQIFKENNDFLNDFMGMVNLLSPFAVYHPDSDV